MAYPQRSLPPGCERGSATVAGERHVAPGSLRAGAVAKGRFLGARGVGKSCYSGA